MKLKHYPLDVNQQSINKLTKKKNPKKHTNQKQKHTP